MNFLSVVSQLCGKIICLCNNAILQVVWVYIICEQAPCKLLLGDNAPQESQLADLIHVTSMIDYQRDMVSLQRVSFFNSFFVVYREEDRKVGCIALILTGLRSSNRENFHTNRNANFEVIWVYILIKN